MSDCNQSQFCMHEKLQRQTKYSQSQTVINFQTCGAKCQIYQDA